MNRPTMVVLIAALLSPLVARAQDGADIREDFSRQPGPQWQLAGGAAVVREGEQGLLSCRDLACGVWHMAPVQRFALSFRYRPGGGVADVLLCPVDREPPRRFCHLVLTADRFELIRETDGAAGVLVRGVHHMQTGEWHNLRIDRSASGWVLNMGDARAVAEDPAPLGVAAVGFGSVSGAAAYDDVRLSRPAADEAAHGTFGPQPSRQWKLPAGARMLAAPGGRHELDLAPAAEATWRQDPAASFTLSCRCLLGGGRATVALQRTGTPPRVSEYSLGLELGRVTLVRTFAGRRQQVASSPLALAAGEWHDLDAHLSGGWIQVLVDGRLVIRTMDTAPLPPGGTAFGSGDGEHTVRLSGIVMKRWLAEHAGDIIKRLEEAGDEQDQEPMARPAAQAALPADVVPLQVRRFQYPDSFVNVAERIDPGFLPPNFVHTWVLDVKGIDQFRVAVGKGMNLQKGDRISFYNAAGLSQTPVGSLASFDASATEEQMMVDLSAAPLNDVGHGSGYRRVFMELQTGPQQPAKPRRFVVDGLVNLKPAAAGAPEVLLLADDLDTWGNNITKLPDANGQIEPVPSNWKVGAKTNNHGFPPPDPAQGWFLLGDSLTEHSQLFYALVYYNERLGRLRLYLKNRSVPTNVTGAVVRLCLRRFIRKVHNGAEYLDSEELKGAFFPLHPNPNCWSSVTVPLVEWDLGSWTSIEVPMLYPMGENLPVDTSAPAQPADWYRSLYEDPFEDGLRTVQLEVAVRTYDLMDFNASFVGKAVGSAIQDLHNGPKSEWDKFADTVKSAASAGGDIAKGAKGIYDGIKKYYDTYKSSPAAATEGWSGLKNVVSMGSSVLAGGIGIASAAYSFFDMLFGDNKPSPLQMSIELDLQGTIKGTGKIEHKMQSAVRFYLPGRFSIRDACGAGLDVQTAAAIAASAPRYDRTLGLFGYRYPPTQLQLPVATTVKPPSSPIVGGYVVYPSMPNPPTPTGVGDPWTMHPERVVGGSFVPGPLVQLAIPQWLPVVYNPCADITPLRPSAVKAVPYQRQTSPTGSETEYRWVFDINWSYNVIPEPDDAQPLPPPEQSDQYGPRLWVSVLHRGTGFTESSTGDYTTFSDQPETPAWYGAKTCNDEGRYIQVTPQPQCRPGTCAAFTQIANVPVNRWYMGFGLIMDFDHPPAGDDPLVLDSAVYHWDIPYFYYGRTRKANGVVPRELLTASLEAPVGIRFARLVQDPQTKAWSWQTTPAMSTLAREPPEAQ